MLGSTLLAGSALLTAGAVLHPPHALLRWIAGRYPDVLFHVSTAVKTVGLTFDDGPHPAVTPEILKVLRLNDARGTFFLLGGRIPEREWIVHQIVDEGHEIGNHLLTDVPSIRLSPTEFERQLLETHRLLSRFAPVRWFRPGSAWFNRVMLDQLRRYGYRCVLGSVYAFDAQVPIVGYVARHILCNVRPGAIIVLHEGTAERIRTAAVLRRVLPELNSRGYRVATLAELVKLSSPPAIVTDLW